jgi:hypothetical protein
MGLEQAHQLVAGRHRLTRQNAPRALRDDALDQWPVVLDLGLPERDRRLGRQTGHGGQLCCRLLEIGQGGARRSDQLAVQRHPPGSAAGERDRAGALLRRPPVIAPRQPRPAGQAVCLPQQPHHHPHRVPQQAAVARLVDQRGGDRAVDPHHPAALELGLAGAGQQRLIDLLPGRGVDRADGPV